MPQDNLEQRIVCPECGTWLGIADKNATTCQGIKIYCKNCKKQQPLIVPCAGKAS